MTPLEETLLLCAAAFFAGLVDAVAGGGGLIQVPALFAVLPGAAPAVLLGTNKVSSIAGTLAATVRYARAVSIDWRWMSVAATLSVAAAALGAWTVTRLPAAFVRPLVFVLLLGVLVYSIVNRRMGLSASQAEPHRRGEAAYAAGMGFYDGFFGPGAGALLMFGLVKWFGHGFLEAAARARVVNLASNAGALGVFLAAGSVDLTIGLPMAVANIAGGYVGASTAIERGAILIRRTFLLVVGALIAKLAWDLATGQ